MPTTITDQKRYIVEQACAAHSEYQGSNKDWAGALVHVVDAQADPIEQEAPDACTWMFLSVYGKSGGTLQGGAPTPLTTKASAQAFYQAKVREKLTRHHYSDIDFEPFLKAFQVPLELAGTSNAFTQQEPKLSEPSPMPASGKLSETAEQRNDDGSALAPPFFARYQANRVEAISVWQQYATARYGMTEKANGERCLIHFDGPTLAAFNRLGAEISLIPEAAQALTALAKPCVIDGERLVGEQRGYVMFDLLHWNGEDLRGWPFARRIALLSEVLCGHRLIKEAVATPTLEEASLNSLAPGLLLLSPVKGSDAMQQVVQAVNRASGEGIIVRDLAAPYLAARAVLKYKFTADLDAVVIGIKPGPGGGSCKLGLRRPSDNAIVAVGHVRAGLTNEDVYDLTGRLLRGERIVIKVEYLPARTVGIALVEGRTSREWIRHDKQPWDCTTDQLGPAKAGLVRRAKPITGIAFPIPPTAPTQGTPRPSGPAAPTDSGSTNRHQPLAITPPRTELDQHATLPTPREAERLPAPVPTPSERRARPTPESAPSAQAAPQSEERHATEAPAEAPSRAPLPGLLMTLSLTTAQAPTVLSRVMEQEKTIIIDVRSKKLLKLASTRKDLDPHTLRTQWGMRYLALGSSLGDEDDQNSARPARLLKPTEGIASLTTLLERGYSVVLVCSCQPARGHLQEIVRLLSREQPVRRLAVEQFLAEVCTQKEAVPLTR